MSVQRIEPDLVITVLAVRDIARAKRFYDAVFGWRVVVDDPVFVEYSVREGCSVALAAPGMHESKYGKVPQLVPEDGVSGVELYVRVNDLNEIIERLNEAGATLLAERRLWDWGEEAAYFRDPEGHVIVVAAEPRQ